MADFKAGDAVTWHSHGSMAGGTIARKITRDTGAVGRSARGGRDNTCTRFTGCAARRT
jgi:hypothetical protein